MTTDIITTNGVKMRVPRGTRVMGTLARTIIKTLLFVDDHPEDANSPKYVSEARAFCKENGYKLEKVKAAGPQETPTWRMTPAEKAKKRGNNGNGTDHEPAAEA